MSDNKELSRGEQLRKSLVYQRKNGYDVQQPEVDRAMEDYCSGYKTFLDRGKTERECVDYTLELIENAGFKPYERGMMLKPGDRIYRINRGKAIMLAVMGSKGLESGANIAAAHIDSPRLDLKQNPLYETEEMAYFKTHYYGGIRKYQWLAIPLELHGVIALKDGGVVKVCIGGEAGDPRFVINDLLPHLGSEQAKKVMAEAVSAENLNILVGSRPIDDDKVSDRVKLAVLELLHEKYGIVEEDFISAELCAVPAFNATDLGFDRSLIGAYGHDDRVCAYAALYALLQQQIPARTAVCILADKEEIGSEGVSGMQSAAFDTFMDDLCKGQNVSLNECLEKSFCLSTDVTAAYDPNYAEVYEKRNSAFINYGIGLCKYTGARGKSGASDASAEVVAYVRSLFDKAGVVWQMAELGRVDAGGGGTVACYMANRNIDTIDAGVPVLSMHAPFETVSKLDCYMTYRGIKAVFEAE
ncbi:MAG: aminopeptidase [Oscillospiraceae bacterium]|nr:aminopeptidase [Oscillospiraceae bacterium]